MADRPPSRAVHLVGSVSLTDAEEVFRTVAELVGALVRRIPDGETGERTIWAAWQVPVLGRNPAFVTRVPPGVLRTALRAYPRVPLVRAVLNRAATRLGDRGGPPRMIRIRDGVRPEDITIGPLGYAAAAKQSYASFARLRRQGRIPAGVRFQVSLPSPIAPLTGFVPAERAVVEPRYTARLLAEVDEITAAIPHDELAIQWDAAIEFAVLEGLVPSQHGTPEEAFGPLTGRLVEIGNHVPADVELGYHLCYGDAGHRHFVEPADTALLTRVANALVDRLNRPISWLHVPVPRNRTDTEYFKQLGDLRLAPDTELYLGLVHLTDGVAGGRRRIAAAEQVLTREFGIATECGFGRRPKATVPELLRLHARLAERAP